MNLYLQCFSNCGNIVNVNAAASPDDMCPHGFPPFCGIYKIASTYQNRFTIVASAGGVIRAICFGIYDDGAVKLRRQDW